MTSTPDKFNLVKNLLLKVGDFNEFVDSRAGNVNYMWETLIITLPMKEIKSRSLKEIPWYLAQKLTQQGIPMLTLMNAWGEELIPNEPPETDSIDKMIDGLVDWGENPSAINCNEDKLWVDVDFAQAESRCIADLFGEFTSWVLDDPRERRLKKWEDKLKKARKVRTDFIQFITKHYKKIYSGLEVIDEPMFRKVTYLVGPNKLRKVLSYDELDELKTMSVAQVLARLVEGLREHVVVDCSYPGSVDPGPQISSAIDCNDIQKEKERTSTVNHEMMRGYLNEIWGSIVFTRNYTTGHIIYMNPHNKEKVTLLKEDLELEDPNDLREIVDRQLDKYQTPTSKVLFTGSLHKLRHVTAYIEENWGPLLSVTKSDRKGIMAYSRAKNCLSLAIKDIATLPLTELQKIIDTKIANLGVGGAKKTNPPKNNRSEGVITCTAKPTIADHIQAVAEYLADIWGCVEEEIQLTGMRFSKCHTKTSVLVNWCVFEDRSRESILNHVKHLVKNLGEDIPIKQEEKVQPKSTGNDLTIIDIEKAVNSIEQDIFESSGEVDYFNISLITNGFMEIVKFCGIELWSSEEDCRRNFGHGTVEFYEPLEECLRRRLKEELAKLATIKV